MRDSESGSSPSSLKIDGYHHIDDLLEAVVSDSVSPAIFCNPNCSYTGETEPDRGRGWCDEFRTNSMKSALILGRLI